jgi:hypothetical protein
MFFKKTETASNYTLLNRITYNDETLKVVLQWHRRDRAFN